MRGENFVTPLFPSPSPGREAGERAARYLGTSTPWIDTQSVRPIIPQRPGAALPKRPRPLAKTLQYLYAIFTVLLQLAARSSLYSLAARGPLAKAISDESFHQWLL